MAILWALSGTFLFTLVFASGRFFDGEIHGFQILWLRFVSGLTIIILLRLLRRERLFPVSNHKRVHFLRSICGTMGGVCFIQSATMIPIMSATALGLTDGLLTVLLSIVVLRERVPLAQWIGILLCILGAYLVIRSPGAGTFAISLSAGSAIALIGALLVAIESILIKVLAGREPAGVVMFYVNTLSLIILLPPALYYWTPISPLQTLLILGLGPIAISAQYCWVKAYQLGDAALVTPINYTWILFSSLIGILYFGEALFPLALIGAALVTAGGVVLTYIEVRKQRRESLAECDLQ